MNGTVLVILALFITIFFGYKKWVNIIPMAAAISLIAAIANDIDIKTVLGFLPVSTMYDIFILTYFFGFAMENGTFEALIHRMLRMVNRHTWLVMPFVYLLSFLLAFIGPGVMAIPFIAPFVYQLAEKIKASNILAYISVSLGCIWGSNFMRSAGGSVVYRLVQSGVFSELASEVAMRGFLITGAITTAAFCLAYIFFKGWKTQPIADCQIERLNRVQKRTVLIIVGTLLLSVIPYLIHFIFTDISPLFDTSVVMTIGCCAASALRLGDDKQVLKERVPWQVIALIGSMGMLIGVGNSLGMTDSISRLLSETVDSRLAVPLLALIAGLMSVFTSAIGVVLPTLYSLVPDLAVSYGMNPAALYIAPFVAATITGCSPLSTTGGMTLAGCADITQRESLFYRVIFLPFILLLAVIAAAFWL